MTNHFAVIDPFVKAPALGCFNGLVELLGRPLAYHWPSQAGAESLKAKRDRYSAYVVLGSASHVNRPLPWHAPLADFLLEELGRGRPVLGCCFGHQLLCHRLGAHVDFYHPDEAKFSGVRTMAVAQDFWNFRRGESFTLTVSHRQVVKTLAPGLLAVGGGLANDLVIHERLPFLGTQAHPEASSTFCAQEGVELSPEDADRSHAHGQRFIRRFFQHFDLL